jgi:geranylgeranyl diphosphate synthase type I
MKKDNSFTDFFEYLSSTEKKILDYIRHHEMKAFFRPEDINESILSYITRPAKRLRPSVLLMACGSLGGEEREALAVPAAVGVELFHTWTLVHDDLIDNDNLRRGELTVHVAMSEKSKKTLGLDDKLSKEYGRDISVLTGDMQHGWCITSFIDCALNNAVDPVLILKIIKYLQSYVLGNLVYGEVLDVQYGIRNWTDMPAVEEDELVNILWLKTGVLYEFSGLAGALIGKNTINFEDEQIQSLKSFCSNCGIAFQLQDDILGILGNEKQLGKPVGSDIREGKKTVIVYESLKNANKTEKKEILSILGKKSASKEEIDKITSLFHQLGGIERTNDLAKMYIEKALPYLDVIDDSKYKELLIHWADFMINREF